MINTKDYLIPASIVISAALLSGAWVYSLGEKEQQRVLPAQISATQKTAASALQEKVLPSQGVELPVVWGNLGAKLTSAGVIDADKFKAIYEQRGGLTDEQQALLVGQNNGKLRITNDNAGYLLNMFWALGLANKNKILDSGEMMDPAYGGAQNFASTGGWTIAKGSTMDHYSRHMFVALTADQQALVDKVSRGIYRPCCGNSAHFPDCNHGMAMLGFLELAASQGVGEQDMWKAALAVNAYWFPDTYLTIATYMSNKGVDWGDVNAQEMLGAEFSGAQGYRNIAAQVVTPARSQNGGGCGLDAPQPTQSVQPQQKQSGCGL